MSLKGQNQQYQRLYNRIGGLLRESRESPEDYAALIAILERFADSEALVAGLVARLGRRRQSLLQRRPRRAGTER